MTFTSKEYTSFPFKGVEMRIAASIPVVWSGVSVMRLSESVVMVSTYWLCVAAHTKFVSLGFHLQ